MHPDSDLISAASSGDLARVLSLLSTGANVNCQDPNLFTPLNCAAWYGHVTVLEALLQHPQVDANKPGKIGEPPLFCAVQRRNIPVIKALLRSPKVDVNYQKRDGATPLLYASQEGFEDEALLLLEDPRVNVNICLKDGTSPLFLAAQSGHLGIVKLLLALGDKINTGLSWNDITPVEQARKKKHPELAELIEQFDQEPAKVRALLKAEVFKSVKYASHTFGLVILHSDEYLRLSDSTPADSNERRFFEIASRLPIEMQMVLSFRLAGMAKEIIPHSARQETFTHLAQKFADDQRAQREAKRETKWKGWQGWTWQPFRSFKAIKN